MIIFKDEQFVRLYEGEIYCGKPHGFGREIDENEIKSGHFHMGRFMPC